MRISAWKIGAGGWSARSVLGCGNPLPLLNCGNDSAGQSARGLAQSKTWRGLAALLGFILLPSAFTLHAWGQSYSLDWHKISGGGGTSTNARFAVSGTIGQPEASGSLTGGRYAVAGGFWSLYAVQTAGAPVLRLQPQFAFSGYVTNTVPGPHYGEISVVSNLVVMHLNWPSPAAAVTVQQSSDLIHWSNYSGAVQDDGTTQSITVTPSAGNLFFRLWR